jgi:signal recognition particle receptor subunit beta
MARHPGLQGREIPFVIMCNKNDLQDEFIGKDQLRRVLQVDRLKTINQKITYFV